MFHFSLALLLYQAMSCVQILCTVVLLLVHYTCAWQVHPCESDCDCPMRNGERCVFRDGHTWHHCTRRNATKASTPPCVCLKGCMGLSGKLVQWRKKTEKCEEHRCSCDDATRNKMSCCELSHPAAISTLL